MRKRTAVLIVGLLISAIALYFAIRDTDGRQLLSTLADAKPVYAIPFLVLLFAFYLLKLFRWQILLTVPPIRPALAALAGPMTIGFAANNLLPFRVGEVIRVILGARSASISRSTILGSLVLERLFDVIAILLLSAFALTGIRDRGQDLPFESY